MTETYSILLTGGAGYLGAVMVPALLAAGHRVTVLDNFLFKQNSLAAVCADPAFDVVRGDARDAAILRPLVAQADIVIPLAALVGAPMCDADRIAAQSTNFDAVRTLLDMLSPQQRVLMPVTNSGYGVGEQGQFCTEESPLKPLSLYGRSKVAAEAAVLDRGNALSFRLATVFGMSPRMRIDLLVNDFVYRALYDRAIILFEPHFKRNFIIFVTWPAPSCTESRSSRPCATGPITLACRTPTCRNGSYASASRRSFPISPFSKRPSAKTPTSVIIPSPTPASKAPASSPPMVSMPELPN
jgi:nucleoside-diphosphate-sugar epimerase